MGTKDEREGDWMDKYKGWNRREGENKSVNALKGHEQMMEFPQKC
jgi:hypothetical protein